VSVWKGRKECLQAMSSLVDYGIGPVVVIASNTGLVTLDKSELTARNPVNELPDYLMDEVRRGLRRVLDC